ncbi:endoribonuclease [Spirochaetota bacterium]|nr:endoribonuclease [Spirochaetota bacterium]
MTALSIKNRLKKSSHKKNTALTNDAAITPLSTAAELVAYHDYKAFITKPMWQQVIKREATKLLIYLAKLYQRPYEHVTIVFMEVEEITKLAEKFHHTSEDVSDVLTFSYTESPHDPIEGDIVLCPEVIFNTASEENRLLAYALIETLLHGMLHLYGLTHSYKRASLTKVYLKQKTILKNIDINWVKLYELVQSR